jgi:hypothetical protein
MRQEISGVIGGWRSACRRHALLEFRYLDGSQGVLEVIAAKVGELQAAGCWKEPPPGAGAPTSPFQGEVDRARGDAKPDRASMALVSRHMR